ncbi:MAG: prepilin-type N-terminal cleavage/methylation domain-containing protein [Clostridia bacterium]|nr:prepilin-type N-terminal cleavage/methylation domain-containing protein [Clostridia bacterium]
MKNNNRGFTLVEIIVVVVIMGVLVGIISLSISSVFSSRARRGAAEIDAYISMCKVNSMSRAGDISIILDLDENGSIRGRYYEDASLKDTAIFADANVTATFTTGGVETDLSDTDTLTLSFDRNTGAFAPQSIVGETKNYCTAISLSSGRTYVIILVPSTGNHYISTEAGG